jgi:hypothetical protein
MQSLQRRHKANFSSQLTRQYCGQYVGWVEVIIEREVCEILNGIWEILFSFVLMDQFILEMSNYPK